MVCGEDLCYWRIVLLENFCGYLFVNINVIDC